jgi:hypothetical protein
MSPVLAERTRSFGTERKDQTSGTYSYLLASRSGGEALIIDPVLEKVDRYLQTSQALGRCATVPIASP